MAFKPFEIFSFIFLIFLLLAPIGHAKRNTPSNKNSSPFDFIKKLKGCHKGNHTKEIQELKAYLEKFGYLDKIHTNNDNFDETLESAIKTYQKNYHIKPSGTVDDETISKMTTPRCGVPDILNNTNYMQPHKEKHDSSSSNIHTVSHYSFIRGNPRWPPSKTHLTYKMPPNFLAEAVDPVARAFQKWESATHFTFARVQSDQIADIVIEFHRGDHGDGSNFDGPRGIIAHAFPPSDGRFHYDADEKWSVGALPDYIDLETVAIHEIGHLLGLGHSEVVEAIMFPQILPGQVKNLHADDIQGINALYGR